MGMRVTGSWISEKTRSPGAEEAGRGEVVLNRQGGVEELAKR